MSAIVLTIQCDDDEVDTVISQVDTAAEDLSEAFASLGILTTITLSDEWDNLTKY